MPFSIYVGNLPWSTTPEDLRALFEPYGEVENARIITDRETGRSRGFGFVDMADEEAARRAIAELHNYEYGGRPLTVNEAQARQGGM
ncbi:MAG: RNA-binding protein [Bacillota bacterium]|uniref:Glycine-rich RNA-binding protein n=2 Tax=Symbiobacterium thermophilum TaxID=2734 RepID=Q67KH3_SYMTH|nr:RNA-binding protein [Symbiobacterium thermophilum]MBY6274796.1 RNA-binding protein [Symbiobacterium thermophilum]OTA42255.1 MAG: RNA-binding protein [Symbiobacterium thermophilum]PZN71358.1 MAG: RNA-binding protein [Bacillota bacterium]BAD41825.1 glycine-rich RNA-binding protein [Symbiobacterium thermophilum IAM 14863]